MGKMKELMKPLMTPEAPRIPESIASNPNFSIRKVRMVDKLLAEPFMIENTTSVSKKFLL